LLLTLLSNRHEDPVLMLSQFLETYTNKECELNDTEKLELINVASKFKKDNDVKSQERTVT